MRKTTTHMVSGFKDGTQWDEWAGPLRCTLKLVNLAAGTINIQEMLGRVGSPAMPSWTTATGSPSSGSKNSSFSLSSRARRDRARPWREDMGDRELHWDGAGLVTPRDPPPVKPPPRESTPTSPKRQIRFELPRVERTRSSPPSGYSTKYFGLVRGELSVLTKLEQLESRTNLSCRSQESSELNAFSCSPLDERGRRSSRKKRRRGSKSWRIYSASCSPYDRLPLSAPKAPVTRPVEAPEPPPWSGPMVTTPIQPFPRLVTATHGDLKDSRKTICRPEIDSPREHRGFCSNCQEMIESNNPSIDLDRGLRAEVLLVDCDARGKEAGRDAITGCLVESLPHPALYDVWIPRQSFQGRSLMQPKRWRRADRTTAGSISSNAGGAINRRSYILRTRRKLTGDGQHASLVISRAPFRVDNCNGGTLVEKEPTAVVSTSSIAAEESTTGYTCEEAEFDCDRRSNPYFSGGTPRNALTGWLAGDKGFDYAKHFSWRTVATKLQSPVYAYVDGEEETNHKGKGLSEGLLPEEQAAATDRTRRRSDAAVRAAIERLRAPQCLFNPLHRAPSRPEMRRSITRGRFSALGRKLWRKSEGLSPRVSQVRLKAAPPLGRILSSALEDGEYTKLGLAPHGSSTDANSLWNKSTSDAEKTGAPEKNGKENSPASNAMENESRQVRNPHKLEEVGVRVTADGQGQGRRATHPVQPAVVAAGTEFDESNRGGSARDCQKLGMGNSYEETGASTAGQYACIGSIGGVLEVDAESEEETLSTSRLNGEPIAVNQRPDTIARCVQYSPRIPSNGHHTPNIGRRKPKIFQRREGQPPKTTNTYCSR